MFSECRLETGEGGSNGLGGDRPVLEVGCRTSRYSGCPCKHLVGGVTHLDEIPLRFQEVEEDAARAVRELAG